MKYKEAQESLRKAIKEQDTISTKKLARILESMNISINSDKRDNEVKFLKQEISKLRSELKSKNK